ncbi:MAG TPA: PIN domain-containing protein [Tepidisphaeraceae bacterium]|jgi:hypothetical protein|nr:PIN domain-containing protein [Tepidisphaeraceae bacterium]
MTVQFVDTYYLLALVNSRDKDHEKAMRHSQGRVGGLLTTTWVLVEFADALCTVDSRARVARFIRGFLSQSFVEVTLPSEAQFHLGLSIYENRHDKDWSLTDCLSFLVMQQRGIMDALTADHHFEQAGFRALMREE